MKITEIFSALFPKVRKAQGPKIHVVKRTDSKLLKRPDEVKLAKEAKLISDLRAKLNKQDSTRQEKIDKIHKELESGDYKIDANELVRKILGD